MTGPARRPWFEVVRNAAGDSATIRIYGDIGDSWWGDSVTAKDFVDELDAAGPVGSIHVHLNSPGGDAFDGITIMNALRDHPANVTVHVDGLAASAASIIAMAGDDVVMGRGSQLMIHDASTIAYGNAGDLQKVADQLNHLSDGLAEVYAEKAGGTAAEWRDAMREETWYSDKEAVAAGLADRITASSKDDTKADPEAMLRSSRVAARYRYKGRAQAPTPHTPAGRSGGTDRKDERMTNEQLATLRRTLGLPEDADENRIVATVGEVMEEFTKADEGPAPRAQIPDGAVLVDKEQLEQLRADATAGREAREEQVRARRAEVVDKAIRDGKILARSREAWLAHMAADEAGTTATIDALEPVVALSPLGHDDGTIADESKPDEDLLANWKVI